MWRQNDGIPRSGRTMAGGDQGAPEKGVCGQKHTAKLGSPSSNHSQYHGTLMVCVTWLRILHAVSALILKTTLCGTYSSVPTSQVRRWRPGDTEVVWPGAGGAEAASSSWLMASMWPDSPWNRANSTAPGGLASGEGHSMSQHPMPVEGHPFAAQ